MNRVNGKVAVVTGGASGIGKAAVLRLAAEGAKVAIIDVNEDRLQKAAEAAKKMGADVVTFQADIANEQKMQDVMKQTAQAWGHIDILFANAGAVGTLTLIEEFPAQDWKSTLENNVFGTFVTVKAAIPFMKQRGGSIVVTSSVSGSRQFAQKGFSAYSTSKAAVAAFAKMAAMELAQFRIRVNAICPGAISTNIAESIEEKEEVNKLHFREDSPEQTIPLTHSPGYPEQVANVFLFLASDEASFVTGTEVYADGGETLQKG